MGKTQQLGTLVNGLTVDADGNVGIATTPTTDRLTISGNTTVLGSVNVSSYQYFTSIYGGYIFGYTGTTYTPMTYSASYHSFSTSGTEKLRITNSGNVGIGTSSPSDVLDVQKNQNATTNFYLRNTNTTDANSRAYLNLISGATSLVFKTINGDHSYIDATSNLYFQSAGSVKMTMLSSGNVGIGTSSPSYRLDTYTSNQYIARFDTSDTTGGFVAFAKSNTATGYIGSAYHIVSGTQSSSDLAISAVSNLIFGSGSSLNERMRITSGGDFLFGATAGYDSYSRFTFKTSTNAYFDIQSTSADAVLRIIGSNYGQIHNKVGSLYITCLDGAGDMIFRTSSGGITERLRIGPQGDIGAMTAIVGQGSGQGNYRNFYWGSGIIMSRDAYDSYFCGNVYYDGSWRLKYASAFGNVVNWYSGEYSFQRTNTNGAAGSAVSLTATFYIDYNGNVVARGSVSGNGNPSDINLKENLQQITNPLEKINQITGYNFDWKQGSPANGLTVPVASGMPSSEPMLSIVHDAGLIAQEVETIMPELVRENGHKSLNYNGITALLVEAVKELKAEIEILKNK